MLGERLFDMRMMSVHCDTNQQESKVFSKG